MKKMKVLPPNSDLVVAWIGNDSYIKPILAAYVHKNSIEADPDMGDSEYNEEEEKYYILEGWHEVENFSLSFNEHYYTPIKEKVVAWSAIDLDKVYKEVTDEPSN